MNSIKRVFISISVFAVLLLACISFSAAEDIRVASSMIDFSTVQVIPEPVEPGQDVTVKVNLQNRDSLDANDVKAVPRVTFPLQLKGQELNWFSSFNLCAQCARENTYYLLIDTRAESGTYPLIFEITKGATKMTKTIYIKVQGAPDVVLLTSGNEPIVVEPKQQFKVDMVVKNIGTGIARNLKIVSKSTEFITSGSNTQFIEELSPGQSANISAYFTGNEDLEPNVYNFPVVLEYKDAVGDAKSYESSIGVTLKNKAELSVKNVKTRPDYVSAGDKYEVSLRVENTGSGSAKNTIVKIATSNKEEITQYIGQLKKDEDSNIVSSFVAKGDSMAKSSITMLNINIEYDDDTGHQVLREQLAVEVHPNTNYLLYIVYGCVSVIAVILFLLYIFHVRRKEKMENQFEEVVEYGLADEFVKSHKAGWNHAQFSDFVKELRHKRFNIDPDRLMRYLEKVRVEQKPKK